MCAPGAAIRTIAEAAGIAPALVMRYHGNKEHLFAVAEFGLRRPDLFALPRSACAASAPRFSATLDED